MSPKGVATGSTNYGYKAVFNTTYPGPATQLSIGQLPNFTDAAGSANLATPYGCTADGKYAVGMNYRGMEKAVLWDTRDASATNWTVTDLTSLAATNGGLNIFNRLTRAYSVGTNGAGNLVITGVGSGHEQPREDARVRDDRYAAQRTGCDSAHGDHLRLLSGRVHVQFPHGCQWRASGITLSTRPISPGR